MKRVLLVTVIAASVVARTEAQSTSKADVFGNYTYMQYNPTVTGLQSRALNGGGGGFQFNLGRYFGLKADFQGYKSTQWTMNVSAPVATPHGSIPAGTYKSNATMFTYLFGPVIKIPAKRVTPFGEILFGGSNTNLYGQLTDAVVANGGTINRSATQHPFTMAIGGGLDVELGKHVALRLAEMDYVLTRYTNPLTLTNNQNSFRYLGGIVFRFGGERAEPPLPPARTTKDCPGGGTVPIDQECPKRDISLGITADRTEVCPGSVVKISPAGTIPEGGAISWTINGEPAGQARAFEFGTEGRQPGTYRIRLQATAPGYNDASAESSITLLSYGAPSGSVEVSPAEIWAGEKATVTATFRPGQCGSALNPPKLAAAEGSISGDQYDSASVQFDPSSTSEQRKTITISANVSDGKSSGSAQGTVIVKKKGAITARRLPDVIFPAGGARVNNCGKRVLLETLKTMVNGDPTGKVVLVGHQAESETRQKGLDQKRALNAAAVISAGKGICMSVPTSQILVSATGTDANGADFQPNFCGPSAGSERPGQAIRESEEAAKYRRVEVWFVPTGGMLPASLRESTDAASLSVSTLGCPR